MADSVMFNVSESFDIVECANRLAELYRAQGFEVTVLEMNNTVSLQFSKGSGAEKHFLGTALGIKATLSITNGMLVVSFSEAAYKNAVISFLLRNLVSLCLFFIPVVGWLFSIFGFLASIGLLIYGCINQSSLAKKIGTDITMLAANNGNSR